MRLVRFGIVERVERQIGYLFGGRRGRGSMLLTLGVRCIMWVWAEFVRQGTCKVCGLVKSKWSFCQIEFGV